jgi:hypothetical protein
MLHEDFTPFLIPKVSIMYHDSTLFKVCNVCRKSLRIALFVDGKRGKHKACAACREETRRIHKQGETNSRTEAETKSKDDMKGIRQGWLVFLLNKTS